MSPNHPGRASRFWLILLLAHLALAQPLFELLGRQAEFLVAHAVTGWKLVGLALLLGLGIPGLLATLVSLPLGRPGRVLFRALAILLAALVIAPALNRAGLAGLAVVLVATAVACVVVFVHHRFPPVRSFFSLFALAVPVFIYLFLFQSRAEPLLWAGQQETAGAPQALARTPHIVFLVLDEFPLVSLLTSELDIDAGRYPNFAWLAQHANWYQDATTGAVVTVDAVPEALTGVQSEPASERLPIALHHPDNLFSLLAGAYDITAQETATLLCPRSACAAESSATGVAQPDASLARDLSLVWAHIVTPLPWANELPSVSDGWAGFGQLQASEPGADAELEEALAKAGLAGQVGWETRGGQFHAFIDRIEPGARPGLYYLHSLLPHRVWQYLPDGRQYLVEEVWAALDPPGPKPKQLDGSLFGHEWQNDRWAVNMARLRHLLQVQYTDALLGELIRRLRDQGMWDDTLLIVAGDHGASFIPGEGRRAITRRSLSDISAVPLFIKLPGQQTGEVLQRQARLVDILPTIIDVLGADPGWPLDGRSLLDPDRPTAATVRVKSASGAVLEYAREEHMTHLRRRAEEQEAVFGRGTGFPLIGPNAGLVGRPLGEFNMGGASALQVQLDAPQLYRDVDPQARFIPAHLSGRLEPPAPGAPKRSLAIANAGRIVAVTQTYGIPGFEDLFEALLRPDDLVPGHNRLRFYLVYGSGDGITLSELASADIAEPRLLADERGERIVDSDGVSMPLSDQRGARVLTRTSEGGGMVTLHGTASVAARDKGTLLVFLDGRFAGRTTAREGLYQLPLGISGLENAQQLKLRAFEVDDRAAREVLYPPACSPDWAFAPPETWNSTVCGAATESPLVPAPDGGMVAHLDFKQPGIRSYLGDGWDVEPGNLTWSTGQQATLRIPLPDVITDLRLRATVMPFLAPPELQEQTVFIFANNQEVARWTLTEAALTELDWSIPQSVLRQSPGILSLTFLTPDAASPNALGKGGDLRILGLAVSGIDIETTANSVIE
ncbi:MAG: sulfatase-like hydrolase/transferase [Xanthomonadales bacterium]|nr:sulfatase-like hydrolase/transferase [Xanthomonadales bacterium]